MASCDWGNSGECPLAGTDVLLSLVVLGATLEFEFELHSF
jgi:hypothetical protein